MLGLPDLVVACLFDLDGVLTDTATVHRAAWKQAFDEVLPAEQRRFDDDDYSTYVDGKRRADGIRAFLGSRNILASEELVSRIGTRKNDLLLAKIHKEGVVVYEGSRTYLRACEELGIRRAVVSSSANTKTVLDVTGLAALVEVRVDGVTAGEQHLAGKPAPDTFLYAAKLLGLEPQQCAVFEDALAGVEAGRAGGFGCVIGVDRGGHADALREHGADQVVGDLGELL